MTLDTQRGLISPGNGVALEHFSLKEELKVCASVFSEFRDGVIHRCSLIFDVFFDTHFCTTLFDQPLLTNVLINIFDRHVSSLFHQHH